MDLDTMCPRYEKAIEVLGKRWTGLILRALMRCPRRFTEITNYIDGLSDRLLSQRLREMEEEWIVERKVYAQRPVLVEYELTEKGAALAPALKALEAWADEWIPLDGSTHSQATARH
jgi:DNA-binding HxlR family transcriptional regulator